MVDALALLGLGSLLSLISGMIALAVLILIVLYVYTAWALMDIAKKTKTPYPWLAWIPVANLFLMLMIADPMVCDIRCLSDNNSCCGFILVPGRIRVCLVEDCRRKR